ncbi:MAG: OmpH family outer membrane protein [Desulfobacter sp.]|nr:MAG: OmpH family outer membrane protein [Desulfobacter sp.]
MKKGFITLAILITAAIISGNAFGADVAKIGVVNFQKVLKESSAGKLTQKELKAKWTELQKKLETEKQEVEKMSLALERESLVLSAEKKRDRQRELRDRVSDLKKMNADFTEEFQILQRKKVSQIEKDVFELTNELGKTEGFLLILERKTAGVIYAPAQVDITDMVIKKYNEKVAKKK